MNGPFGLFRRRRNNQRLDSCAVRSEIVIRVGGGHGELFVGPGARLARRERNAIRCVAGLHDPVVGSFEEQELSVMRPDRQAAAARSGSVGSKGSVQMS